MSDSQTDIVQPAVAAASRSLEPHASDETTSSIEDGRKCSSPPQQHQMGSSTMYLNPPTDTLQQTFPSQEPGNGTTSAPSVPLPEPPRPQPQTTNSDAVVDPASTAAPSDIVEVVDPMTRKLQLPRAAVEETRALHRDCGLPSLCMLHLEGRCRQGGSCNQLHADPTVVANIRTTVMNSPVCCQVHGDVNSAPLLLHTQQHRITNVLIIDGRDSSSVSSGSHSGAPPAGSVVLSVQSIAFTHGVIRILGSYNAASSGPDGCPFISSNAICRLHAGGLCRFGADCRFVHLCREVIRDQLTHLVSPVSEARFRPKQQQQAQLLQAPRQRPNAGPQVVQMVAPGQQPPPVYASPGSQPLQQQVGQPQVLQMMPPQGTPGQGGVVLMQPGLQQVSASGSPPHYSAPAVTQQPPSPPLVPLVSYAQAASSLPPSPGFVQPVTTGGRSQTLTPGQAYSQASASLPPSPGPPLSFSQSATSLPPSPGVGMAYAHAASSLPPSPGNPMLSQDQLPVPVSSANTSVASIPPGCIQAPQPQQQPFLVMVPQQQHLGQPRHF